MKKRNSLYIFLAVAMVVLVAIGLMPAKTYAAEDGDISGGTIEADGITASKHVTVQEDGTYVVDLEAFSTGEVTYTQEVIPCDIVLVLDTSSSMDQSMSSIVGYEQVTNTSGNVSNSWSSNRNTTYSYKDSDSVYHQITIYRTASGRNYYYTIHVEGFSGDREVGPSRNLALSDLRTAVRGLTGQSNAELFQVVTENITRLKALQNAVNAFLGEVANNNAELTNPADYSKVSIVTFNRNSSVITGSKQANANSFVGVEWNSDKTKVMSTESTPTDMYNLVNTMPTANWTYTHLGMDNATSILNSLGTSTTRKHIVVLFTDGVPCDSGTGDTFNNNFATQVINSAKDMKDPDKHNATVFTIAVYPGADPTVDPTTATGTNNATLINKLLHATSSNFPTASATGSMSITFGTRDASAQHYFVPTTANELKEIFETIGHSSGATTSNLDATTVMKDIVSSSFTLPPALLEKLDPATHTEAEIQQAINDYIHISIIPWDSSSDVHNWSQTTKYTIDQWKNACLNYGAKAAENVAVNISDDGKTIDITGFDYATHFLATSDPAMDKDGVNDNAAKIYIYFEIDAQPSAVTGGNVATNGPESGIYFDGKPVINFPIPQVKYRPVSYVVDYVTSDTSTDTKASSIKLDYTGVLANVTMLDDPSDDILKGKDAVDFGYTIYKGKYGTISFGDDDVDVQRRYVRYAPTTMNWNGYDRIFIKGESATDDDKDVWAMLCALPANSVFYEDTYITQTKTVTYNNEPVTIEYTGINYDKDKWDTVGTEGKNQTQHAGSEMGWIEGLADDSSYANDMAHKSDTPKAKATFTFTGTGVDIYSRTNGSTGTVSVRLQGTNPVTGKKFSKSQFIDTKAAAGDFFAIPVCTFTDLTYGEYTVTIMVTTGGESEDRMTFYLDGVRVYNPIQSLESEENVQNIYGKKNLGAIFTEVRDMLSGDTAAAQAEVLYIDEHYKTDLVDDVGAIEAAAKDLADAQAARDEYVEGTITPAKNAVSEEEYAKEMAASALTAATEVYNVAKKNYDDAVEAGADDATIQKLKEAMDTAEGKMNEADAANTEAINHYEANIGNLKNALDAAIAGKATYDKAIEDARAAYQAASDNKIEIATKTSDIALYQKEGPKHEVLLDKNQGVTISVDDSKTYYIGLRSLNGDEVKAKIGGKTVTLSHSVDLYYEAEPVNGVIAIQNVTESEQEHMVLSVTKLRTTDGVGNTDNGLQSASTEKALKVFRTLAKQSDSEYTGDILTEEEVTGEETASTEEPAVEEVTETALDESDITIDNPETGTESATQEAAETGSTAAGSWAKLLSSFIKFFRR